MRTRSIDSLSIFTVVLALALSTEAGAHVPVLAQAAAAEEGKLDPLYYVIGFIAVTLVALLFGAKVLFPNAKRNRAERMAELAERFPFLAPLVDNDKRSNARVAELRELADEVTAHKEGALQIDAADLGRMASPVDVTIDASFHEQKDLEIPVRGPNDSLANMGNVDVESTLGAEILPRSIDDSQATNEVINVSKQLGDEVPFDAVSPEVKPQMRPLVPKGTGGLAKPADNSETIDVAAPKIPRNRGQSIGDLLRQSGELAGTGDDDEATIIRESGPVASVPPSDRTARENVRAAGDPDATTNPFANGFDD